jgi:hypothetical protein
MGNNNIRDLKFNFDTVFQQSQKSNKTSSDILVECNLGEHTDLDEAYESVISFGKGLKTHKFFKSTDPKNLIIKLLNADPFIKNDLFVKSVYNLMENAIYFQYYNELLIEFGDDFVFAMNENKGNNLQTYIFAYKFNFETDLTNQKKEYFFQQKCLLDRYYMNIISQESLTFLSNCLSLIVAKFQNLAIKPKGFFIHLPKNLEHIKNKKQLLDNEGNHRLLTNFIFFLKLLETFNDSMFKIILSVKFQVEDTSLFFLFLNLIFEELNRYKEFNFIIDVGKSCYFNNEMKIFLKEKFKSVHDNRYFSSINYTYEKDQVTNNYKLLINRSSRSFFKFIYMISRTLSPFNKLYRKKPILLNLQKLFFVTLNEIIENDY